MDFFYKYKTIIFLTLFSLFCIFLVFILYTIFFHNPGAKLPTDDGSVNTGVLPGADKGSGNIVPPLDKSNLPDGKEARDLPIESNNNLTENSWSETKLLTDLPGSSFTAGKNNTSIQYYNQVDGKFYTIDKSGNRVPLSDKVFYQVQSVAWSNSKDKAVIEYPDGANIVYDFSKDKQVTLPSHWKEFDFSPNDQQIVAKSMGLDPDNRWLTTANIDGTNVKYIEPLGDNAGSVIDSWSPNNQSIALMTEGIDLNRQTLYFVGQNQENFKATVIEGRGLQTKWAPDGTRIIYSVYSTDTQLKPSLWIVAAQGESIGAGRRSIGLETWADKCTFTGANSLYCAVPQDLQEGAGLFPDLANSTTDAIYKVDLSTGAVKLVSIPDTSYTISDIVVSEADKTIFFVDKNTNLVHKIDL